ncbi:MAG: DNA-directed RNA polymerase subunit omega [Eubacteriales bacterium]|nr:DNA-directed RNA polymerase subunit omega [Eubacteriales bacterium]
MLYPPVDEIKDKADSRYTLCILAAKRARDLIDGKPVLVDVKVKRPVSIAADEIYQDLVSYKRDEAEVLEEEREHELETEEQLDENGNE